MKKIALSLILLGSMAFAAEANATKAEANATKAKVEANATATKTAAKTDTKAVAGNANDGKKIFAATCKSCHGANGQNHALTKSDVIAGWDAAKVVEALKGYRAGTRNKHGMGNVMKSKVEKLKDADIANVAAYIASLKK